ncbi:uncharacterized protein LOC130265469 [Oenanthe melanoleuca]|uniref:uncharacterized protein LOC130265469 n=1 Tax=Oenanthe melanoleuca TaxID=2939378 RepID=UPI0024C1F1EF|nr:uncharacterized protein LOC130265469 [Oenanthe melanoleuca]
MTFIKMKCKRKGKKRLIEGEKTQPVSRLLSVQPLPAQPTAPAPHLHRQAGWAGPGRVELGRAGASWAGLGWAGPGWEPGGRAGTPLAAAERVTEWGRLERHEVIWFNLSAESSGSTWHRLVSRQLWSSSREGESTSLGNLFQCTVTCTVKSSPPCSGGTSCSTVCAHCLLSYCWAPPRKTWLHPVDTRRSDTHTAYAQTWRQTAFPLRGSTPGTLPSPAPTHGPCLMAPEPAPRWAEPPQPRPAFLAGAAGAERCRPGRSRPASPLTVSGGRAGEAAGGVGRRGLLCAAAPGRSGRARGLAATEGVRVCGGPARNGGRAAAWDVAGKALGECEARGAGRARRGTGGGTEEGGALGGGSAAPQRGGRPLAPPLRRSRAGGSARRPR